MIFSTALIRGPRGEKASKHEQARSMHRIYQPQQQPHSISVRLSVCLSFFWSITCYKLAKSIGDAHSPPLDLFTAVAVAMAKYYPTRAVFHLCICNILVDASSWKGLQRERSNSRAGPLLGLVTSSMSFLAWGQAANPPSRRWLLHRDHMSFSTKPIRMVPLRVCMRTAYV